MDIALVIAAMLGNFPAAIYGFLRKSSLL